MYPGDVLECSLWLTGDETKDVNAQHKSDLADQIKAIALNESLRLGPVKFKKLVPSNDRVPAVPVHIRGKSPKLLVAEARVLSRFLPVVKTSFLSELDRVDLERLRAIARRIGALHGQRDISDVEIDLVIEETGPAAALDALRQAVDSRMVH